MFFPVLLLRDYGLWGWVAFAVPNVVGAAAMGFVLRTPGSARALWHRHAGGVRWFSDVTLAFHVFFAFWLCDRLFGPAAWGAVVVPMLIIPAARRAKLGPWLPVIAAGVWLLSIGCFSVAVRLPGAWSGVALGTADGTAAGLVPRLTTTDLWLFIPATVTGFLCCPYLDGSFLRARAATDVATGRAAFSLGFGVVFLSMIVFSLLYAGLLIPVFAGQPAGLSPVWRIVLGVHILVQILFTVTVHVRERMALDPAGRRTAGLVLMLLIAMGLVLAEDRLGPWWGEAGYRGFLLMYGLVFPAYVWLVMLSRRTPGRATLTRFFITTVVAMPMGVLGFVLDRPTGSPWWLIAALGVITVGKAVPLPKPPA